MVVLSTPEGEDKPQKYSPAMLHTDTVIITKTGLAQYADENLQNMKKNGRNINPKVHIMEADKVNGNYTALHRHPAEKYRTGLNYV
jgi:Ni2+-binding GTPase involved in maturation of urease and hydrogenase